MAVHFQGVEIFVADALGLGLDTAEDLRLGFGIEAAQLVAYAVDGGFHLAQGKAEVADLLLNPAAEDRGFTGQVDQTFEQFRRHLDQLLRRTAGCGFLGGLLGAANKGQHLGFTGLDRLAAGGHDGRTQLNPWCLYCSGCFRQRRGGLVLTVIQALAQGIKLLLQRLEAGLHINEQALRPGRTLTLRLTQELLQVMAEITQAFLPGQACSTLEGMQDAQHIVDGRTILTILFPAADHGLQGLHQLVTFLQEDIEDVAFRIVLLFILDGGLQVHGRGNAQLFVGVGAKTLDGLDQRIAVAHRTLVAHRFEHAGQAVMAGLQQGEQGGARAQAAIAQTFVEEFKLMGQIANLANLGHACTTLEGVQITLQGFQLQAVVDVFHPALQSSTGAVDNIEAFLQEDFHQLRVTLILRRSSRCGSEFGRGGGFWFHVGKPVVLQPWGQLRLAVQQLRRQLALLGVRLIGLRLRQFFQPLRQLRHILRLQIGLAIR